MDAATAEHIIAQVARVLEAEAIHQNRKQQMGDLEKARDETRTYWKLTPTPANPWTERNMTIGEQLKAARAQLQEARSGAAKAVAESNDASSAVLVEVKKVIKEANDLRAEVAELTNGGPV